VVAIGSEERAVDALWPEVMRPDRTGASLAEWIGRHRAPIDRALERSGAILFTAFEVGGEPGFERAAAAVCGRLHAEYGDLPRGRTPFVYEATPYPAHLRIDFHNEGSHTRAWPERILFHCVEQAEDGGETELVDGRRVLEGLDPGLAARFDEGLVYVRNFDDVFDVPWQRFFRTEDRGAVEARLGREGVEFAWTEHGLRTRRLCPAIVRHPRTRERAWFNQIRLHHSSCLDPRRRRLLESRFQADELPRNVLFADGTPIPDSVVDAIGVTMETCAFAGRMSAGDVLLVDNVLIAHSRRPYAGRRRIVVAMGDVTDPAALAPPSS
jgi:TfdA family taurine catabolism dioxygenase TauD